MTSTWRGIYPSLPTPFLRTGGVDPVAQRAIVKFAIEHGAHGLICFGLAGEVLKLAPDERLLLSEVIVDEARGRVPVLLGVGAESEHVSCELARAAETAGADGVVIAPPLVRLDGAALRDYFVRVAQATALPVMIQDAPDLLGVEVGHEVVSDVVRRAPNVKAVKLEVGAEGISRWHEALHGTLSLFGGNGGMYLLDCLRAGAAGIAPGLDTIDFIVRIYDLELKACHLEATKLFRELLPLLVFEMQDIHHYNACAKHVLARRGVAMETHLCPPSTAPDPTMYRLLEDYVSELIGKKEPRSVLN